MCEKINKFDALNILDYKKNDNFIKTTEIINADKLAFIVNNKDIFEPILINRRGDFDQDYDTFGMAKKYLELSRNGKVAVSYRQRKGVGRYNGVGSMSLQNITREIRHTVSDEYYIDIDVVNCHPTILKFICDNCGIACPILTKYVKDRAQFFKDNNISKDVGKLAFLAVINGGSKDYNAIENKSDDYINFYNVEIKNIHATLASRYLSKFEAHRAKRVKNGENNNHEASFMNILLLDVENILLQFMWRYFDKPNDAVLCFDGLMLKKGEYDIEGCELAIREKYYIDIKLAVKPFDEGFDLSQYVMPKYVEMSLEYYNDYENIINKDVSIELVDEWCNNSLVLIDNGGKSFFLTKNKRVDRLTKEVSYYWKQVLEKNMLDHLKVICNILNPEYDFDFSNDFYSQSEGAQKKLLREMPQSDRNKLNKHLFNWLGRDVKNKNGYLQHAIEHRKLKFYNNIEFHPYLRRKGIPADYGSFNMFAGFPLEDVELLENIPFEQSALYKHIKNEMMSGDDDELNHFLDHLADLIQDPAHIKTNGHLFYTDQGMGKGMLAEFISKLIGTSHLISFENTEAYFGNFNVEQTGKLMKVFEELSSKGSAFKNHDRLKGDMSKKRDRIEPKGIDAYETEHCARYLFFTNNENALFVEGGDRRLTLHRANNRYANNYKYFDPMWAEVRNEQFCKNAFEYFATRKYDARNAHRCYETQYKIEQKETNLPNGLKFMKEFVENEFGTHSDGLIDFDGDRVRVKDLNYKYKLWCENIGVKYHAGTFKSQLRKIGLVDEAKRHTGVKVRVYFLNNEKLASAFGAYLKNPKFKFDMLYRDDEIYRE